MLPPSPPGQLWLAIGMPSVPRKNIQTQQPIDYLSKTLDSLADALPEDQADPYYEKIKIWPMNNHEGTLVAGPHTVYTTNKARFQTHPKGHYFNFAENPGTLRQRDLPCAVHTCWLCYTLHFANYP